MTKSLVENLGLSLLTISLFALHRSGNCQLEIPIKLVKILSECSIACCGDNEFSGNFFILLNLILSCLAALQAPIILMSQNREAQKDRIRSQYDYAINRKAEREIEQIQQQLNRIEKHLH